MSVLGLLPKPAYADRMLAWHPLQDSQLVQPGLALIRSASRAAPAPSHPARLPNSMTATAIRVRSTRGMMVQIA